MAAAHHTARSATGITASVRTTLRGGLDSPVYTGAVWALGDGEQSSGALGVLDPADPATLMTTDAIFDVASLTKIMAVWAPMGVLWENGKFSLNDPLAALLPELDGYPLGQVTVHQLLTHTAGSRCTPTSKRCTAPTPQPSAAVSCGRSCTGRWAKRSSTPTGPRSSSASSSSAAGAGLDDLAHKHVWAPLGMAQTRFGPLPPDLAARCALTELDEQSDVHLKGTAHDFSARLLGGVCGIAGVFSTLTDTAKLLRFLLDPAAAPHPPGFGPSWVAESLQLHTGELQPVRSLFWLPAPGTDPLDDIYVHYGFTGTGMWISPKQQRWAVLLTTSSTTTANASPSPTSATPSASWSSPDTTPAQQRKPRAVPESTAAPSIKLRLRG